MTIKTILCPITRDPAAATAIQCGLSLARSMNSHLMATHIRPDPKDARSNERSEDEEIVAFLSGMFSDMCEEQQVPVTNAPSRNNPCSASWKTLHGAPREVISIAGRLADLIVVGRPGHQIGADAGRFIRASLFNTSTPVLLLPGNWHKSIGSRVVIAWDKGPAAMQAVKAALPMLSTAEDCLILSGGEADKVGPKASELKKYLRWHGIKADTKLVKSGGIGLEKRLYGEIQERGCDLVVMGAYSRSQISRFVFGSFTGFMLNGSKIPLLLRT